MRYLDLLEELKKFTPEQLQMDVTISTANEEYFPARLSYVGDDQDVLDPGHPVLDTSEFDPLEEKEIELDDDRPDREKIIEASQEDGRRLYTDYSGRGMFGQTCLGIVCDDPSDTIADAGVHGARQDSLGRSTIVYWPHIKNNT